MVPQLLEDRRPVLAHHPLGASTGYLREGRSTWDELLAAGLEVSGFAIELAALTEAELPSLVAWLERTPLLPFRFLSVHAPTKDLRMDEHDRAALLATLPVDAIVIHPDAIEDPAAWAPLGSVVVVENMDPRKRTGRTVEELHEVFVALPEAGFCLDVAHAAAVDPSMAEARLLLDAFGSRLRHLHVSSLDAEGHHVALTRADEARYAPALLRCRDVPWILEAPVEGA